MGKKNAGKKPSANPSATAAAPQVNPLDLSRLLSTDQQRRAFTEGFLGKPIIPPKHGSLLTFSVKNFLFPTLFRNANIESFCQDKGLFYPELVRVFYCNLTVKNNRLLSSVKGKIISLDLTTLGTCLNIPSVGDNIGFGLPCPWDEFNKKSVYFSLCRMSEEEIASQKRQRIVSSSKDILSVGPLFLEDRLIHYFLSYVLVPKFSNHSQINDFELQVIYALKNNKPLNWSFIVMQHMKNLRDKNSPLPYARAITHILRAFDVSLEGEHSMSSDNKEHLIDLDVITRSGFVKDPITHLYRHKTDPSTQPEDDTAPQFDPPPPSQNVTNEMLMDRLMHIEEFMTSGFTDISRRLDYIEVVTGDLRADMGELSQMVANMGVDEDEDEDGDNAAS